MSKNQLMPALFIGHGSPMNALEDNNITKSWQQLGKSLEKPRAILFISAHWYTPMSAISAQNNNQTIHDFFGFPEQLVNYQYPSKGSIEIAKEIQQLLSKEITLINDTWGLDHGVWSILIHMYPHPEMPILQLSIDATKPALWHYELGKKLYKLRENGIMLIGSGNIVHNLGALSWHKPNYGNDWAVEFDIEITNNILSRNFDPIINYHSLTKSALLSVPTPEHFLPLLYILGSSNEYDKISVFNQEYQYGSLSMTSILINKAT